MKTKLLIILATLSLQGCMYQNTSMSEITAALDYCKDRGGLYSIKVSFSGDEYAYCVHTGYKTSPPLDSLAKEK